MPPDPTVTLDEGERQMLLLALAQLALDRPGWEWTLGELAEKYQGREMFNEFMRLNKDRWEARPPAPLV
jgi:hypothetical protein